MGRDGGLLPLIYDVRRLRETLAYRWRFPRTRLGPMRYALLLLLLTACGSPTKPNDGFAVRARIVVDAAPGYPCIVFWRAVASDSGHINPRQVRFSITVDGTPIVQQTEFSEWYPPHVCVTATSCGTTRWTIPSDPNDYLWWFWYQWEPAGPYLIQWSFESANYVARDSATVCSA